MVGFDRHRSGGWRRRRIAVRGAMILAVAALFFLLTGCGGTGNRKDVERKEENSVPNQVLVRFKKGVSPETVLARMGAMGFRVQKRIGSSRTYLMAITDGRPMKEVLQKLRSLQEVELAEPNYITPLPRVRGTIKPAS